MKQLSVDARAFVDGVTSYIEHEEKASSLLPRVTDLFQKVTNQTKKQSTATVVSAILLTTNEKEQIGSFLQKLLGHDVTIEVVLDPSLIGGIRMQVGDWVVDTSLATQIDSMGRLLTHI